MRAAIDAVDTNFKIVLSVDSPGVYGNTSVPTDDMVQVSRKREEKRKRGKEIKKKNKERR